MRRARSCIGAPASPCRTTGLRARGVGRCHPARRDGVAARCATRTARRCSPISIFRARFDLVCRRAADPRPVQARRRRSRDARATGHRLRAGARIAPKGCLPRGRLTRREGERRSVRHDAHHATARRNASSRSRLSWRAHGRARRTPRTRDTSWTRRNVLTFDGVLSNGIFNEVSDASFRMSHRTEAVYVDAAAAQYLVQRPRDVRCDGDRETSSAIFCRTWRRALSVGWAWRRRAISVTITRYFSLRMARRPISRGRGWQNPIATILFGSDDARVAWRAASTLQACAMAAAAVESTRLKTRSPRVAS